MLCIPNIERAMPTEPLLMWDVIMPPLHDGKLPEAAETKAQDWFDLRADAGRDRRPQLYRSCARRCALLRRNQRQYLQVAARLDGQVQGSRAAASSRCSCCSCLCCMMAELSRRCSCKMSSGAAARPQLPSPGRMHGFYVLPGDLQACSMCLTKPIRVQVISRQCQQLVPGADAGLHPAVRQRASLVPA